jgi:formylglycine-generating enzyme required for sulfatase activity
MKKLPRLPAATIRPLLVCLASALLIVPTGARNQTSTVLSNLMPGQLGEMQAQLMRAQASLDQLQNALSAKETELQQARQREISAQQMALEAERHTLRLQSELEVAEQSGTAAAPAQPADLAEPEPLTVRDLSELHVAGCTQACPSFVVIPSAGPVTLGTGDEAVLADIKHRFAMGRTEVTVGQWRAFWSAADRNYSPQASATTCQWNDAELSKDDGAPVRCVSAADAEAYARWFAKRYATRLGAKVQAVGLPTELEWEFSARGGRYSEAYLWDASSAKTDWCRQAQFGKCAGGVVAVASRQPNGYGLYDMVGNVSEWQASPWREQRSAMPANGDDPSGRNAAVRSVRGASYNTFMQERLSLSYRQSSLASQRDQLIGFRLVLRLS